MMKKRVYGVALFVVFLCLNRLLLAIDINPLTHPAAGTDPALYVEKLVGAFEKDAGLMKRIGADVLIELKQGRPELRIPISLYISISSIPKNPFVEIGGWRVYYGSPPFFHRLPGVEGSRVHSAVYTWKGASLGGGEARYKQIIIDIRDLGERRERGSAPDMVVHGWLFREFVGVESQVAIEATRMKYVDGGGLYAKDEFLRKGEFETLYIDPMFSGYVIPMVGFKNKAP